MGEQNVWRSELKVEDLLENKEKYGLQNVEADRAELEIDREYIHDRGKRLINRSYYISRQILYLLFTFLYCFDYANNSTINVGDHSKSITYKLISKVSF